MARVDPRCGSRRGRLRMSLPRRVGRWTRCNNGLLQVQRGLLRGSATRAAGEFLPAIVVLVPVLLWRQLLLRRLLLRRRLGLMSRASVLWGHRSGASGGRSELLPTLIALVVSRLLFRIFGLVLLPLRR